MRYTIDPRRNANVDFYLAEDPRAHISPEIIEYLSARVGRKILDLGCGIGGNALRLSELGFEVVAADRNPAYVSKAKEIGIDARLVADTSLPFGDESFDSVILVEVVEHLPDGVLPELLTEARRVTRGNVLVTVPNCTQSQLLRTHGLVEEHYLTVDHVQFFDVKTLDKLLRKYFPKVVIRPGGPIYPHVLLPPVVRRPLSLLYRLGLLHTDLYSRLFAEAKKHA